MRRWRQCSSQVSCQKALGPIEYKLNEPVHKSTIIGCTPVPIPLDPDWTVSRNQLARPVWSVRQVEQRQVLPYWERVWIINQRHLFKCPFKSWTQTCKTWPGQTYTWLVTLFISIWAKVSTSTVDWKWECKSIWFRVELLSVNWREQYASGTLATSARTRMREHCRSSAEQCQKPDEPRWRKEKHHSLEWSPVSLASWMESACFIIISIENNINSAQ